MTGEGSQAPLKGSSKSVALKKSRIFQCGTGNWLERGIDPSTMALVSGLNEEWKPPFLRCSVTGQRSRGLREEAERRSLAPLLG